MGSLPSLRRCQAHQSTYVLKPYCCTENSRFSIFWQHIGSLSITNLDIWGKNYQKLILITSSTTWPLCQKSLIIWKFIVPITIHINRETYKDAERKGAYCHPMVLVFLVINRQYVNHLPIKKYTYENIINKQLQIDLEK